MNTINSCVSDGKAIVPTEIITHRPDLYGMRCFFDTGDIVLYFVEVPASSSSIGECSLYTKSKNIPFQITKGKTVTFLHQDDAGNEYELSDDPQSF